MSLHPRAGLRPGVRAFAAAGMDGFFTDNPDLGVIAVAV